MSNPRRLDSTHERLRPGLRRPISRWFRSYLRRYRKRRHVRPWALATPILVLLICLPMLHPLQHPDPREMSNAEAARLATIRAIVEDHSLAVRPSPMFTSDRFVLVNGKTYADQPPILAVLLSPVYAATRHYGYSFENNPVLVPYLITLAGATIPVGAVAGLIYRLGRMFELRRPLRTALAAVVVFGSGLLAYGTALNPHAPAAALLLASIAALIHLAVSPRPFRGGGWLALSGLCAALAAAIDPLTLPAAVGIAGSILAMRWSLGLRVGAILLFLLGCAPIAALHAVLTIPLTGDLRPAAAIALSEVADRPPTPASQPAVNDYSAYDFPEEETPNTIWDRIGHQIERVTDGLFGAHGVLSHFPVLLVGLAGVYLVLRRHWPAIFKALAVVTLLWSILLILYYAGPTTRERSYGPDFFIPAAPLLLFWAGAWLRRPHRPPAWTTAALLLLFSLTVTALGTANVSRRHGLQQWGPIAVFHEPAPPRPPKH